MYIYVTYKDGPELSSTIHLRHSRHSLRSTEKLDNSVEKTLLVNPDCSVRSMLEYIRKKCRLGMFTQFDLCDESGILMNLFSLHSHTYATNQFEHKNMYYLIVIKLESNKTYKVLPQLNHENKLYSELKRRVTKYLATDKFSPPLTLTVAAAPTIPVRAATVKAKPKKK